MKKNRFIGLWVAVAVLVVALQPFVAYAIDPEEDTLFDGLLEGDNQQLEFLEEESITGDVTPDEEPMEDEEITDEELRELIEEEVSDEEFTGDFPEEFECEADYYDWLNRNHNDPGYSLYGFNKGPEYYSGTHVFSGYITNKNDWHIHSNLYGSATAIYYNCTINQNDFYEISCVYSSGASLYVYSGDYVCNRKPYSSGGEGAFFVFGGNIVLGAMPASYEYLLINDGKKAGVDYKVENGLCINLVNSSLKIHGSGYRNPSYLDYSEYKWIDYQPYAAVTMYAEGPAKVSMYAGQIYWCSSSAINLCFDGATVDNYFYGYGGEIFECSNYAVSTGGYCKNAELSGMNIHHNYNGVATYDQCSMKLSKGNKIHDIINASVENNGSLLIDGGEIYNNSIGVYNNGTLAQKMDITGNFTYDVWANQGRYENYGFKSKVMLGRGQVIHGMSEPLDAIGEVNVVANDVYLGRTLYAGEYGKSELEIDELVTVEKKDGKPVVSFNVKTTSGSLENRGAVALKGNGVSAKKNEMVLSVPLKVEYASDYEASLPEASETFWAAGFAVSETQPHYFLSGVNVDGTYKFAGWKLKGSEALFLPGDLVTDEQVKTLGAADLLFTDEVNLDFDVFYDGNGQTAGDNMLVKNLSLGSELEKNWFEKEGFAWLAWWDKTDGKYWDLKEEELNLSDFFYRALEAKSYEVNETDGHMTLTLYCLWDKIPEIEDTEIFVDIDKVMASKPADLKSEIEKEITADDLEDGKLPAVIEGFDYEELVNPTLLGGSTSFVCQATDGAGNVGKGKLVIHLTTDEVLYDKGKVRYIDEENYKKSSSTEGALDEHSLWYVNEDYKNLILQAFAKIKGQG